MKKKKIILRKTIEKPEKDAPELTLLDVLAAELPLSKAVLKEALIQGSCRIKKPGKGAWRRIRRAKSKFFGGESIEFFFDPLVFEKQKEGLEESPSLVMRKREWSAWYKPAGWLTQGTNYGDSLSLLRYIEKETKNEPFLIHRLDRETRGLVVVAHTQKAAKLLSTKWQGTLVQKIYEASVLGTVEEDEGKLTYDLEGKKAITYFKVLKRNKTTTKLELRLGTGRTHQIRKHLEMYGHPVMGDPLYGEENKNRNGLQLFASQLIFDWKGETINLSTKKNK